ncbi:MAG: hypothetical protein PHQ70_07955 [Arcobacter sp.]|uniref:hypothetical protein n=1 Tax=Arcobacter sp. TaxID=1872629 RepID=UPI002582BAE3|nr:hypothetical protein [Arcobacter sp.]MDD3008783.1 hypothetical protein [Arcobacter sp.]
MKILGSLFVASTLMFANGLVVKNGDVLITLNNVEKSLKNNENLALDFGSTVCFKGGEGRVLINEKIQLKKPNKCYLVPTPKEFNIKEFVSEKTQPLLLTKIDSTEKVKSGVSTKGTNDLDDGKDILLKGNDDLIVYSDMFGPLPVTVNLKDEKGNILMSVENEDNDITLFKVVGNSVKTGYKVEVISGMEEVLIDKKIVKE